MGGDTETGGHLKVPVGWVVPGLPELCQAHEVERWMVVWGHNKWGCAVNSLSSYLETRRVPCPWPETLF